MCMSIAGSDEDARTGPALLPSGPKEAYDQLEPLLNKAAAEVDHHACVGHMGVGTAAVFIKTVFAALEIGESQLLAEQYDLMRQMRLSSSEISDLFAEWNKGDDENYLLHISSIITGKKDADVENCKPSDNFLVERIADLGPSKKVSVEVMAQGAAENVSSSIIDSAIFARYTAADREHRSKSRLGEEEEKSKESWIDVDMILALFIQYFHIQFIRYLLMFDF